MEKKRKQVESSAQQESSPLSKKQPQLISDAPIIEESISDVKEDVLEEVNNEPGNDAEDVEGVNEENGAKEEEEYEEVYEDVIEEVDEKNDAMEEEENVVDEEEENAVDEEEHKVKKKSQEEPLQKLMDNFNKDLLVSLIAEYAEKYTDIADRVRLEADKAISSRKIFVFGIGSDSNTATLTNAFKQYGQIVQCKAVRDRVSKKSKGYGFVVFKSRKEALEALKTPHKMIGNRVASCRLVTSSGIAPVKIPDHDRLQRKIHISNLSPTIDPVHLAKHFSQFGEIEEGPLGLSKEGKLKSFCFLIYKTVFGAKKALKKTRRKFQGHVLHCQKADGPKKTKSALINSESAVPVRAHMVARGGPSAPQDVAHYAPVHPFSDIRVGSSSYSPRSYVLEHPPTARDRMSVVHTNRGLYDFGPARSAITRSSRGGYGGGYSSPQLRQEDPFYYTRY